MEGERGTQLGRVANAEPRDLGYIWSRVRGMFNLF